jgi:hypothetical protein
VISFCIVFKQYEEKCLLLRFGGDSHQIAVFGTVGVGFMPTRFFVLGAGTLLSRFFCRGEQRFAHFSNSKLS